ncbi:hypothetical protein [Cohnella boryungensis]|jgi:hypothetical protein|uniref:Cardiolipin synthase N-terminal domain-containing protein n=1 Tax=Cohnella boryungensis TaxID=768479 RepID=A0ABV8S6C8_9BACL
MLLLLFLVIIPSGVGIYYMLKPPVDRTAKADPRTATPVKASFKGFEDASASAKGSAALIRNQTVNE